AANKLELVGVVRDIKSDSALYKLVSTSSPIRAMTNYLQMTKKFTGNRSAKKAMIDHYMKPFFKGLPKNAKDGLDTDTVASYVEDYLRNCKYFCSDLEDLSVGCFAVATDKLTYF